MTLLEGEEDCSCPWGTAGDAQAQRLLESARYGSRSSESCNTTAGVHSSGGHTAKERGEQTRSPQR